LPADQAAADDARNLPGVADTHVDVRMAPAVGETDRAVLYQARGAIEHDPRLSTRHIAVEVFQRGGRAAKVALELPDGPLAAPVDPGRLVQVLINLLENAARYSPPGLPIVVAAARAGAAARIEVRDQGPGLHAADRERIFGRFVRGAAAEGTSGLGIGLYLCRAIVERHGGTIGVESLPGAGATFWIELPAG